MKDVEAFVRSGIKAQQTIDALSFETGEGSIGQLGELLKRSARASTTFRTNPPFDTMKPDTQAAVRELVDVVRGHMGRDHKGTGDGGLDRAVDHAVGARPMVANEAGTAPFSGVLDEAIKVLVDGIVALDGAVERIEGGTSAGAAGKGAGDPMPYSIQGKANAVLDHARQLVGRAFRLSKLLEV